jgi:hypothetical protein
MVDLIPTLAGLAGLPAELSDSQARDGQSLVPLMARASSKLQTAERVPLDDVLRETLEELGYVEETPSNSAGPPR